MSLCRVVDMHRLLASGRCRFAGQAGLHCLQNTRTTDTSVPNPTQLQQQWLLPHQAWNAAAAAAVITHRGQQHAAATAAVQMQASHGNAASAQLITSVHTEPSSPGVNRPPYIIAVCGGTASGKTSVCNQIIAGLIDISMEHRGILSLPQDCFYRNLTPEEAANIRSFNFDHPDAFGFEEMVDTLQALKAGRPVEIPMYDFVTSARLPEVTQVKAADVVMFDGILAFYWPELRDLFDLKIFVDADADTRLSRRMRRDIVERGRDVIAVLEQYERTVKPSFESFTLPTKAYADIIVPRGADNTVAIDLLLQHIRFQLTGRRE